MTAPPSAHPEAKGEIGDGDVGAPTRFLDLKSGIGLVLANTIGAGVFLSYGFMAQDLGPAAILGSWVAGGALAVAGATAYGALATAIAKSGGEYRYLSARIHPAVGFLAGWASLLLGFSAPIAIDAIAVGAFLNTVVDGPDPRALGVFLIVALTALHAFRLRASRATQNVIVALKIALVLGFVVVGLLYSGFSWPTWTPPKSPGGATLGALAANQFWIAFAFSGWNAAIYAAEEFRDPVRDVRRAMLIGAGGVAVLYLVVNALFVFELDPAAATVVFDHEQTRATLAHALMRKLTGEVGGAITSVAMAVVFLSAMSAMTLTGPRVYAAMARDGFLPRAFIQPAGAPPTRALLLQSACAVGLLLSHSLLEAMQSVSAVLMFFSGLTAASVVTLRQAPLRARACGGLYAISMGVLLAVGLTWSPRVLLTLGVVFAVGATGYAYFRVRGAR